ncbi:MAG: LLM class flavin-dependent oxidoreductase [Dehalococcoidia bacterium]|jgi:5,10-methylenetetrahydromethanopterin reductase|nr:LLM class flavin-dependent oxidoreductase [Dehalococcoidia bacterium]
MPVAFGLNRFDSRSVDRFVADVQLAEELGWDHALIPDSQLRRRDTFVLLAAAARETTRIGLGTLLANPMNRHPHVTASSIATVDELAPGRTLLAMGVGDTAVRLSGLRPARVSELEDATRVIRTLLAGESVDAGAAQPARLPFARPVPVWIAAGGPRTLRMAGAVAEGVFLRVGAHETNLRKAIDAIRAGASDAGRDPASVRLGLVLHTVLLDDAERALRIGKSMAAGYYEYSPTLFEAPGIAWDGPPVEELKKQVFPDFHHALDLDASGALVDFLPAEAARAFSIGGTAQQVADQLSEVLAFDDFEIVVPHPMPNPPVPEESDGRTYMERIAREVMPAVKQAFA